MGGDVLRCSASRQLCVLVRVPGTELGRSSWTTARLLMGAPAMPRWLSSEPSEATTTVSCALSETRVTPPSLRASVFRAQPWPAVTTAPRFTL